MQKAILQGLSTAMVVVGLYLAGIELFWATVLDINFITIGAVVALLGAYLLVDELM